MKHKNLISILLCIIFAFCAVSCKKLPVVIDVSQSDERETYKNPETGVVYVECSMALMPVKIDEAYCKSESGSVYATVRFQDPLEFLCDDTRDTGYTSYVYRASTIPDITMENFEPIASQVYKEGEVAIFMGQLTAEKQYLDQSIQDLIDTYSEGESPIPDDSETVYAIRDIMCGEAAEGVFPFDDVVDKDCMLHLRLLSATYPGLAYIVVYYRTLDGNDYLYDYGSQKSYECPLDITLRLWEFLA